MINCPPDWDSGELAGCVGDVFSTNVRLLWWHHCYWVREHSDHLEDPNWGGYCDVKLEGVRLLACNLVFCVGRFCTWEKYGQHEFYVPQAVLRWKPEFQKMQEFTCQKQPKLCLIRMSLRLCLCKFFCRSLHIWEKKLWSVLLLVIFVTYSPFMNMFSFALRDYQCFQYLLRCYIAQWPCGDLGRKPWGLSLGVEKILQRQLSRQTDL